MKKKDVDLYYWCPVLSNVATVKAVINSVIGINRYSKNLKASIIDTLGEWKNHQKEIEKHNISLIKINNLKNFFPKYGIFMRLNYIKCFIFNFFPLLKLLKTKKPDFIVVHLITSLPLLLKYLFKFETQIILRISGYPRLNFLRKFFWKLVSKDISIVTCPTKGTYDYLRKIKVFNNSKIYVLEDPVISISEINKYKKTSLSNKFLKYRFILIIGRMSKQKNHKLIIENFKNEEFKNYNLLLLGDGELKSQLSSLVKNLNLNERIFFLGYDSNIYKYLLKASFVIIPSLWEDPGWVMIEAAATNTSVIASDCKHGPKEFLDNQNGGYLFLSNSKKDMLSSVKMYNLSKDEEIFKKKVFLKKKSRVYSVFNHSTKLEKIINDII